MSGVPRPPQMGADELCQEIEVYLKENLGGYLDGLQSPKTVVQAPSPDAAQSGLFPVLCISSPGLAEPPTRSRDKYTATWVIVVSAWVRGHKLTQTTALTRRYVKAVRTCLLAWGQGTWVDEGYAQVDDPESAGTLGAGFVELQVFVETAADLTNLPPGEPLPLVTSTILTVSPKE